VTNFFPTRVDSAVFNQDRKRLTAAFPCQLSDGDNIEEKRKERQNN
jgi:hypothetical protein